MASGDFKVLPKRTTSDKLRDEASNNAKNTKYDGYQRGLASMVYKFFDKKSALGVAIKNNHILINVLQTQLKSYTNQLSRNLKNIKYTHHVKTMFVVLI